MNDVEADVYEALSTKGLKITPQVGCSRFRIDLAAAHPTSPGRFVLAIECDGATYHSSYTARDRDKLRQQQLENLGWTFHRIWSTDWFMRKDEEVERAVQAFHKAVAKNDSPRSHSKLDTRVTPAHENGFGDLEEMVVRKSSRLAPIPVRSSIGDYSSEDLLTLVQWVQSDGKLRSHEEIADEMFSALPFSRRGSKIDAALRSAIQRWEKVKGNS
jgi:very-short-patch-repair endonuclease